MSNVLKGYYENHLHFFYTCRKYLRNKNAFYDGMEQDLLNAATEVFNFTVEHLREIENKKLRLPTSVFSYRINGCDDIGEVTSLLQTVGDLTEAYQDMLGKDSDELLTNACYVNNYIDISKFQLRFMEKDRGILKKMPDGSRRLYDFTIDFIQEAETLLNKSGVYMLYDAKQNLIYIGKSYDLGRRLLSSASEREAKYYSYSIVGNKCDTDIYEIYYIGLKSPILNSANNNEDSPAVVLQPLSFTPPKPTITDEYRLRGGVDVG